MSFLTPLYLLGALAILGPIVFHLIRKTPRGQVNFSSLMFLQPTPPRLTRRSRLDDILLLLLRALALGLLAFAFARPFLRETASLNFADAERQRVTLLIDTSASMRRGDLWPQARKQAEAAIDACRPGDQLALYAFDATTRPLLSFAESSTLDPSKRQAVARGRLAALEPSWSSTNLGQGLVDAVGATEDVADASEKSGRMPRRIVLITDLQQGGKLEALGDFEWPKDVELDLKLVRVNGTNAGLQSVVEQVETVSTEADPALRVRISNEPGATRESFRLVWVDARGKDLGQPVEAYVPPGESRVIRVPRVAGSPASLLRLEGDSYPFDNRLYLASTRKQEATVIFVGDDPADDPNGLLYYLDRVFEDSPTRLVRVVARSPRDTLSLDPAPSKDEKTVERTVPLVVLAGETSPGNLARLGEFARGGGTVLRILKAGAPNSSLLNPEATNVPIPEAAGRDVMLGELAFDHPLFSPFAGAQFNDFTRIRFWKHRSLDATRLKDARVIARFEGGDPAIVEQRLGKGAWVILTSGWSPSDSQLARSSKFVPLMASFLEAGDSTRVKTSASILVGDRVPLPVASDNGKGRVIRKPDGSTTLCDSTATFFEQTDEPGVYSIEAGGISRPFAVNLDPLESRTAPWSVETLEQLGCRMASESREVVDRERIRQMQTLELEGRQKLWRWLILATVGILIVETWLAGRLIRSRAQPASTPELLAR